MRGSPPAPFIDIMREQNKRTTSSGGVLDVTGGDVWDADGASLTCLGRPNDFEAPAAAHPPHPESLRSHTLTRFRPGSRLECFQSPGKVNLGLPCCGGSDRVVGVLNGSLRTGLFWCVFPWRTVTIRSQISSAGIPSNINPASKEMISDSVELCETEVASCTSNLLYKCVTSENAQCSTLSRFESLRSPAKSESWDRPRTALFPHDNTVCTHKYDEYLKSNENRLSQALVHLVVDRASLFTDHRMSGRPTRAKYAAFRNNLRAYFWQFSYIIQFFFFEMMVINAWRRYCVELLSRFVRQLTISFHTFPGMTFQVIGTRRYCFRIRFPWSSDR